MVGRRGRSALRQVQAIAARRFLAVTPAAAAAAAAAVAASSLPFRPRITAAGPPAACLSRPSEEVISFYRPFTGITTH